MKRTYHEILSYIHENEESGIREISSMMVRGRNDYRDFYGLVSLLQGGYIGFTGPIIPEASHQARLFQCYAQGHGFQTCGDVQLFESDNEDSYLYIGPKGIEYFHQRAESRKSWIIAAILALIASIISGVVVAKLTDDDQGTCKPSVQASYNNALKSLTSFAGTGEAGPLA